MASREAQLYESVKKCLEDKFYYENPYFEVTADKISNKLKKVLDDQALHLISVERTRPDIMGYYKQSIQVGVFNSDSTGLIVAEIKNVKLKVDDIYQIKKYAEVFNADRAFLISPEELSEEIRRFLKKQPHILSYSNGRKSITIAQFDQNKNELKIGKKSGLLDGFI